MTMVSRAGPEDRKAAVGSPATDGRRQPGRCHIRVRSGASGDGWPPTGQDGWLPGWAPGSRSGGGTRRALEWRQRPEVDMCTPYGVPSRAGTETLFAIMDRRHQHTYKAAVPTEDGGRSKYGVIRPHTFFPRDDLEAKPAAVTSGLVSRSRINPRSSGTKVRGHMQPEEGRAKKKNRIRTRTAAVMSELCRGAALLCGRENPDITLSCIAPEGSFGAVARLRRKEGGRALVPSLQLWRRRDQT